MSGHHARRAAARVSLPPLVFSRTALFSDSANATTRTLTGVSFGAAAADRYIFLAFGTYNNGSAWNSSVTIGGVSATLIAKQRNGTANGNSEIWAALVPTGTTGTIVITTVANQAYFPGGVFRCTGLQSLTPVSKFEGTETATESHTPTMVDGNLVFAYSHAGNAAALAIGNLTNDFKVNPESHYYGMASWDVGLGSAPSVDFTGGGYWWNHLVISMR